MHRRGMLSSSLRGIISPRRLPRISSIPHPSPHAARCCRWAQQQHPRSCHTSRASPVLPNRLDSLGLQYLDADEVRDIFRAFANGGDIDVDGARKLLEAATGGPASRPQETAGTSGWNQDSWVFRYYLKGKTAGRNSPASSGIRKLGEKTNTGQISPVAPAQERAGEREVRCCLSCCSSVEPQRTSNAARVQRQSPTRRPATNAAAPAL